MSKGREASFIVCFCSILLVLVDPGVFGVSLNVYFVYRLDNRVVRRRRSTGVSFLARSSELTWFYDFLFIFWIELLYFDSHQLNEHCKRKLFKCVVQHCIQRIQPESKRCSSTHWLESLRTSPVASSTIKVPINTTP